MLMRTNLATIDSARRLPQNFSFAWSKWHSLRGSQRPLSSTTV